MMSFGGIEGKRGLDKDFCISCIGVRKWGGIGTKTGKIKVCASDILYPESGRVISRGRGRPQTVGRLSLEFELPACAKMSTASLSSNNPGCFFDESSASLFRFL
jgi:hypothetical protein